MKKLLQARRVIICSNCRIQDREFTYYADADRSNLSSPAAYFTLTPLDGDGNKLEEDAVSGSLAKDKKGNNTGNRC